MRYRSFFLELRRAPSRQFYRIQPVVTGTVIFAVLFLGNWSSVVRRLQSVFLKQQDVLLQTMKMTPLTNSGKSVCAVISPDGKYVARAEKKDGKQELLLTGIATAGTSVVVPLGEENTLGSLSHATEITSILR
jgi:hypothetical protein